MAIKINAKFKVFIYDFKVRYLPSVPDTPHMDKESVDFLTKEMLKCNTYLEFGSGGSTVLASRLNVPNIISVESDPKWIQLLQKRLSKKESNSKVNLLHSNLGRITAWGTPINPIDGQKNYAEIPWPLIDPDQENLLILIDGRYRVACFLVSILRAPVNSLIIFDDYFDRSEYWVVESFLTPKIRIGRSAVFSTSKDFSFESANTLLKKFRMDSD